MEAQQDKSWVVKVQKTPDSPAVVVASYSTKYEANRRAVAWWRDDVYKVTTEYE